MRDWNAATLLSVRKAILPVVIVLVAAISGAAAVEGPHRPGSAVADTDATAQPISLGIGKWMMVDLPRDAKDVLVANPQIANAVVGTARRAYLIGVAIGQTNVFFFDAEGRQIAGSTSR